MNSTKEECRSIVLREREKEAWPHKLEGDRWSLRSVPVICNRWFALKQARNKPNV